MKTKELIENFTDEDTMGTVAIDYVDDMLAQLSEEEQYGEQGDILRYILSRLQEQA